MMPSPVSGPLEVYLLGVIEYADALDLQRRLVYQLGETGGAALLLCEHPPTVSVGRAGSRSHILPDDDQLHHAGIDVVWVNRGGGCQFHLPGLLNAYLAVNLESLGLNLQEHIDRLHRVGIEVLADFDLKAKTRPGSPGLFLNESRVASLGVAVKRWIAYHGLGLNVAADLGAMQETLADPDPTSLYNGGSARTIRHTSMEARRQRPASMPRVRESVIDHVEATYGLERRHIFTAHPMIRRKVRPHAYAPSFG